MAKIIDFKEKLRKKVVNKIVSGFGEMNKDAGDIANEYYQLMLNNPYMAIQNLPNFIEKAKNIGSYPSSVVGGPNHDWTAPMMDILGIMYPYLEKDIREEGLFKTISFLNKLNYSNAQDNVELINEPWLVADIVINSPSYWCGHAQYCDLLEKNKKWIEVSEHLDSVKSEFWLAFTISQPKYSTIDIRKNFYKEYHHLMDRTKDAIAAIIYYDSKIDFQKEGTPLEEGIQKELIKYDTMLHKDIQDKIKEEKWIKINKNIVHQI